MISSALLVGAATQAQAQASTDEVSEVVVTGTRIPSPNLESVSPVTAIGAAELKAQGVTRVEDLLNSLPQAFAGQGGQISNGATGTATIDLRGLGPSRTLVLIDGRRLMPGAPNANPAGVAADINFIPSALVQRIDVLTGGASAVYGADAVAGVVNFVMERNFEGVRLDAQYGTYQHVNNNDFLQNVVTSSAATSPGPQFYSLPKHNVRDGEQSEVTLTLGVNAPDGKGNVTLYAGYRHVEPVIQANRDYSSCTLNSSTTVFTSCGGSPTSFPARVGNFIVDPKGPGNTFRPRNAATDVYNFGPTNYYQRPDDRYVMGAFAHYELAPWATAYADLMFMNDVSTAQIAPGGIFAGTFAINCANPLVSDQQKGLMTLADGSTCLSNPGGTFSATISRRNVEGGGRQTRTEFTQYRYVIGLRGDLNEHWNYDGYLQYGRVSFNQAQSGFFRKTAIDNALNVVNVNGVPTCVSVVNNTDPKCVPYNIFRIGGVTEAALDYLQVPSTQIGETIERVVNFTIGGDLTDYGVKSPWATEGIGISMGGEYRREQLAIEADFVAAAGLLNGLGGAAPPVHGSFDVYEAFGEARIPLIQDMPFIKRLQAEVAYRYSDYSTGVTTDTYKLAGDWQINDDFRLRASYQRAVRAANILELFSPQNVQNAGTQDPCAGLTPGNPLVATCAKAFNLTTAQVLAIEKNPAAQYNGQVGGNPNLDPEKSDTYSFGIVATPTFLPGLNLSVDYFSIKATGQIGTLAPNLVITQCLATLDPFFCKLVHRDAAGSLFLSTDGFVQVTTLNTGAARTKGVDLNLSYRTDLDSLGLANMGSITVSVVGTYLDEFATKPLPGGAYYDCAKLYGTTCGVPAPRWRHKARLTWNTPFEFGDWLQNASVSLQWRHFDKVTADGFSKDPQLNNTGLQYESDRVLASRDYFDLTASWAMKDRIKFRAGINNIFDKEPPLNGQSNCAAVFCNGNTYPQVYDALGRYAFIGLTADF